MARDGAHRRYTLAMQTIALVRHAIAIDREEWENDDHLRPLTAKGQRQAEAIAKELGASPIAEIRSSPALRCVQTVEPLAVRAGITLTIDQSLMEGSAITLPKRSAKGLHVLCAHGDNIPALLDKLGVAWNQCKKGSIWMVTRNDQGKVTNARYIETSEKKK